MPNPPFTTQLGVPRYFDPRFADSQYPGLLAGDRPSTLSVYNPPPADYEYLDPLLQFLGGSDSWGSSIAPAIGAGAMGGAGAGYLGAENFLRARGRQALIQNAIQGMAQKYNLPPAYIEAGMNPRTSRKILAGITQDVAQGIAIDLPQFSRELAGRNKGNSILGVLTKSGRQVGARRKGIEMKDYADLYDLYTGQQGLLSKDIGEEMAGLAETRQAFSEDPFSAPVPPKQSKRYVPENVPKPENVSTRAGAQRGAGQIAEGIKPTFATKVLGLNKPPSKFRARATTAGGILGTGLGMASPIINNWGGNLLAGWRAGKEQKELVEKGATPAPTKTVQESVLSQRDKTQKVLQKAADYKLLDYRVDPKTGKFQFAWNENMSDADRKYLGNWLGQAKAAMSPAEYARLLTSLPKQ